jgi:hypothetical protein
VKELFDAPTIIIFKMKTQTMTEDYSNLNFLTGVVFIIQFCQLLVKKAHFTLKISGFSKICFCTIVRSEHKKIISLSYRFLDQFSVQFVM